MNPLPRAQDEKTEKGEEWNQRKLPLSTVRREVEKYFVANFFNVRVHARCAEKVERASLFNETYSSQSSIIKYI